MTSPLDPSDIPLPHGDDTAYFNTPVSSVFAATPNTRSNQMYGTGDESTPTTRALPPFTHPNLASVYSNMNTPTPANMLSSQDLETPRGRPQRRGGKYHPGVSSALRRDANPGSSVRQPSQSSGPDSKSDEELESMSEEEGFGHEDLDQTVAVNFHSQSSVPLNMSTPLQRQFPGLHYSSKSHRTPGPGHTPARNLLATSKSFFGETPVAFQKNAAIFMNPDILPSAFSEDTMANFPCLSSATPHKLNTIQGSPAGINPYQLTVENSQLSTQLRQKDAKIRYLEEMISGQTQNNFDDFFDFSPEKKMKLTPNMPGEDTPLTVKKRRRSPTKGMSSSVRKSRTSSRTGSKSPVKVFPSLFESIATPIKLSTEEKKEERRRRETREFKEFSAIDLEMLKGYLPPVADEERVGDIIESIPTTTKKPKSPVKGLGESIKVDKIQCSETAILLGAPKSRITTPFSPVRRTRQRRSNSAPPVPETLLAKTEKLSPIKETQLQGNTIATLQARVAQLEGELETTSINLQKAVAALGGERRARIAAEETWRFLELERKYGVCCQFADAAGRSTAEAAATVPLPTSPAESVRSVATSYSDRNVGSSRYNTRPPSRMASERPESRMGGERPVSRMERERGTGHSSSTSKIGLAPTQTAGKKRVREESANSGIAMRKAPIPRQAEKRVLSGGVGAANVPLGGGVNHSSGGGLLKKPALGTGVGAPPMKAPVRVASGAAAGTRSATGLSRGARR